MCLYVCLYVCTLKTELFPLTLEMLERSISEIRLRNMTRGGFKVYAVSFKENWNWVELVVCRIKNWIQGRPWLRHFLHSIMISRVDHEAVINMNTITHKYCMDSLKVFTFALLALLQLQERAILKEAGQ